MLSLVSSSFSSSVVSDKNRKDDGIKTKPEIYGKPHPQPSPTPNCARSCLTATPILKHRFLLLSFQLSPSLVRGRGSRTAPPPVPRTTPSSANTVSVRWDRTCPPAGKPRLCPRAPAQVCACVIHTERIHSCLNFDSAAERRPAMLKVDKWTTNKNLQFSEKRNKKFSHKVWGTRKWAQGLNVGLILRADLRSSSFNSFQK